MNLLRLSIPVAQIQYALSWLGIGTSIKSGWVKLVLLTTMTILISCWLISLVKMPSAVKSASDWLEINT